MSPPSTWTRGDGFKGISLRTSGLIWGLYFGTLVIGAHGYLRLQIRSYIPSVDCDPFPFIDDTHACSVVRDNMPASAYPMRFGRICQRGASERVPIGGLQIFDRMLSALASPKPPNLDPLLLAVSLI